MQRIQRFKAEFFKGLAHPTQVAILELLRQGGLTVSESQLQLATEATSVSRQLAGLCARDIVEGRRGGTSVHYRVRDPQVFDILDIARTIFDTHVRDLQAMADEEPGEDRAGVAVPTS